MINLLPPEDKQEIIYGRKNRSLVSWNIALLAVLVGIMIITVIGQFYIKSNVNSLNKTVEATKQRIGDQNLEQRQLDTTNFANNLNTVNSLLKDQLLFSKIITSLGGVLPDKVTVLNIDFESSDNTLKLQLVGNDEKAVTQGFVNLSSAESSLFERADLESVDCSGSDECIATVTVLLNKDSDFYFLNDVKSKLNEDNNE